MKIWKKGQVKYGSMFKVRPVVRSKIMTPLRDAMDFINGKKCNSAIFCKPLKGLYKSAESKRTNSCNIYSSDTSFGAQIRY